MPPGETVGLFWRTIAAWVRAYEEREEIAARYEKWEMTGAG
jgi:hypothetical protein